MVSSIAKSIPINSHLNIVTGTIPCGKYTGWLREQSDHYWIDPTWGFKHYDNVCRKFLKGEIHFYNCEIFAEQMNKIIGFIRTANIPSLELANSFIWCRDNLIPYIRELWEVERNKEYSYMETDLIRNGKVIDQLQKEFKEAYRSNKIIRKSVLDKEIEETEIRLKSLKAARSKL